MSFSNPWWSFWELQELGDGSENLTVGRRQRHSKLLLMLLTGNERAHVHGEQQQQQNRLTAPMFALVFLHRAAVYESSIRTAAVCDVMTAGLKLQSSGVLEMAEINAHTCTHIRAHTHMHTHAAIFTVSSVNIEDALNPDELHTRRSGFQEL